MPTHERSEPPKKRRKWAWISASFVLFYILMCLPLVDHRRYTCSACRINLVDHRVLFFRWSSSELNESSRWYSAHVEPTHDHVWAEYAHCRRIGLPGIMSGWGCTVGSPIAMLGWTPQRTAYEHSRNLMQTKDLFVRMGKTDREAMELLAEFNNWLDQGCQGAWEDWWRTHLKSENTLSYRR